MASPCGTPVHFCHFRAARLNANGTRMVGADNRYETAAGIEMAMAPVTKEAERFEQQNGCGDLCSVVESDCDRVTGYTLTLQLCQRDFELMELLLGGSLATSSGETVGYADPDPLSACNNGTIIEGWSYAWDGDQQMTHPVSGSLAYFRTLFPKVRWRRGDETLAKGQIVQTLIGKAVPNINAGLGVVGDWPQLVQGARGDDIVTTLPASNCGSLPTLAVAS